MTREQYQKQRDEYIESHVVGKGIGNEREVYVEFGKSVYDAAYMAAWKACKESCRQANISKAVSAYCKVSCKGIEQAKKCFVNDYCDEHDKFKQIMEEQI